MSTGLPVVPVLPGPFDAMACAETTRAALVGEPLVTGWLAPDITSANQVVTDLALLIQYVVEHGGAGYMLDDRSGVAVWHTSPQPPPTVASLRRSTVDGGYATRWTALEDLLYGAAGGTARGHVLVLFVVTAGDDRAAALLGPHHAVLDARQQTAYTAAFSASVQRLLTRHGWTAAAPGRLPDGGSWWPMHRLPHTTHRGDTSNG